MVMRDRFASKSNHMKRTILFSALLAISFAFTSKKAVAQNSGTFMTANFHNNLPQLPANDSGGYGAMVFPATLTVYPNPAVNELSIDLGNNLGENKSVYSSAILVNASGVVLMTIQLNPDRTKIEISSLPTGMYYITLRGESGIKVLKFEKMQ